jgi:hypothetical protein
MIVNVNGDWLLLCDIILMSKPIGKQVVSPASLDKLVLLARYTEAYDDGVSAW